MTTRWLASSLRTPARVRARQQRRLRRFLRDTVPGVRYYAHSAATKLEDLPIVDKAMLMNDFAAFNVANIDANEARDALARKERVRGFVIGQSTGTSGNRGYYVIDEAERMTWLGVIVAKALPNISLFAPLRIALVLPSFGELYGSIAETRRFALRFFDLARGIDCWHDDLRAFAPDVIVAPPKALRVLAQRGGIRPRHVFSGAEVLDDIDRRIVEDAFGVRVREIYMATEGLLGVACERGTLHLAEDIVAFEFEPTDAPGLVIPIVTDFTRTSQIMARYRMNDLLRLRATPCPCGSPYRAVDAIEGRCDDIFVFERADGSAAHVTPDVIRNAIVDAHPTIVDFRVLQSASDRVVVSLEANVSPDAARAVVLGLQTLFARHAANVRVEVRSGIDVSFDRKLRRVRRA